MSTVLRKRIIKMVQGTPQTLNLRPRRGPTTSRITVGPIRDRELSLRSLGTLAGTVAEAIMREISGTLILLPTTT